VLVHRTGAYHQKKTLIVLISIGHCHVVIIEFYYCCSEVLLFLILISVPMSLQRKRISAADALTHPFLEEGRIRYHACMCSCCRGLPASYSIQRIEDLEPTCQKPFLNGFEDDLMSKAEVKRGCKTLLNNK